MSNKGVGIAFKLTALVLLLGILGVSIGILIITLNVRDDVEATPAVPTYPTTPTISIPTTTKAANPPSPTTTSAAPAPPCTNAPPVDPVDPVDTKTTTEEPVDPVDPVNPDDGKNIPAGNIIAEDDPRHATFSKISSLYESWMDLKVDPCNDFYHYVCGKGQKTGQQSPFQISQDADDAVIDKMWNLPKAYWTAAPLPVNQARWFRDKCIQDTSYTEKDQQAKQKEMLQQFLGYTDLVVPWFAPNDEFTMDKATFSKLLGYGKGEFGIFAFLTTFASVDFKHPDDAYTFYVDQPLPLYTADLYANDNLRNLGINGISSTITQAAEILGIKVNNIAIRKMAGDLLDFDKVIATTMQQDSIVRRQVERNYNVRKLSELNAKADYFDWVLYIQGALTLLGDQITATEETTVIVMETDILDALNDYLKKSDPVIVANYLFLRAFAQIIGAVPAPPSYTPPAENPLDAYRPVLNRDKRTLTGMLLRKPEMPDTKKIQIKRPYWCGQVADALLPWATTRLYVDVDMPNPDDRKTLKSRVAEIAQWIFFGFRSQLDQLNWMDTVSKKGAFDKLDNIQLNIAFPDWVADDKALTDFYKDLDITQDDSHMNNVLKMTNYFNMQEVLPFIQPTPRDRGDFSSFIGITNAWYQPQMNSITFPEGILQEPFYSPDFPIASIFGGLGSISGHELTHGFDDQGVQWDGIGALNAWMQPDSQASFNAMAKCVIDEYNGFCPFPKPAPCVNGANTQGENIADNGGIQAAYKALKAYESLNGADPRLPGFGSTFTSDQLFFLTFAQTWCDKEQTERDFAKQVNNDVHSPALFRVLGTIQNFPAFKNAFNCPANTPYTPDKHCNVWTSKPFADVKA